MAAPDAPAACLLHFGDERAAAARLAAACGLPALEIARHRFPDGELKLTLPVDAAGQLPARAVLLRSRDQPNEKLIELLLAARSARSLGVRQLTLVAPYLAYMRQDIAFHPGEAVSQRIVGPFLASLFDAVVTVDPHLHRVATLDEAVPAARTVALSGAPLLADWIVQQRPGALLVGPDGESAQWVAQAAARHGLEHAVCTKERHGDRSVTIHLPPVAVQGRAVVLLDDMASTGHTLAQAARLLLQDGAASVDVAVTHALIDAEALAALHAAGAGEFWSTDCVAHPMNAVAMAVALARGGSCGARGLIFPVACVCPTEYVALSAMVQQPVFWWPACVTRRFAAADSFQLLVNFWRATAWASIGGCQNSKFIGPISPNPSGNCLAGRSAALRRLWIAELYAAPRALHPNPAKDSCNSKKTLNQGSWKI